MSLKIARPAILFLLPAILLFSTAAAASSSHYLRLGDKTDSTATPVAGTAMMGGGQDLDEAFRWLCKNDLSDGPTLGLAQFTPDIFASHPVIGSGGSRHIQVGAKIIW
jgi:hypothetical protein